MLPTRTLLAGSSSRATVSRKDGPPAATPNATGRKANRRSMAPSSQSNTRRPSIAICRSYGRDTVLSMRLNAYLARAGVASRRGADELIKAGRVTVNGEPGQLNTLVQSRDRVELDGEPVEMQPLAYVLLYKPAGVVTTARDPQARRTVVELVDHPARVVPVGRLDVDTTGALLLTNDGELAHRLAHPRYEVEKVLRGRGRGRPERRRARTAPRRDRARRHPDQPRAGPPTRPGPRRAQHPRRPKAPGEADARGRRAPCHAPASQPLCGADARRARARPLARARALRSGTA